MKLEVTWKNYSIPFTIGKQVSQVINITSTTVLFAKFTSDNYPAGPANQNGKWEELMTTTLADALDICGYGWSFPECISLIKTRIQRLVIMALKLNYLIEQETSSIDVRLLWFTPWFRFSPPRMRDENESRNSKSRILPNSPILATTALGLSLQRLEVNSRQDQSEKSNDREVVIRATVVLPDSIQYKGGPAPQHEHEASTRDPQVRGILSSTFSFFS